MDKAFKASSVLKVEVRARLQTFGGRLAMARVLLRNLRYFFSIGPMAAITHYGSGGRYAFDGAGTGHRRHFSIAISSARQWWRYAGGQHRF